MKAQGINIENGKRALNFGPKGMKHYEKSK